MDINLDTIIAPATIPGTGAISLIRISGPGALGIADSLISFKKGRAADSPGGRVKFGTVQKADGTVLDEVLCCIYRNPASYTGEDSVEIMCHASAYIVGEILRQAIGAGCRMAGPGEFTQRAFLAGKMDLTQAEAVADVVASSSEMSHRVAMNQLRGGFSRKLARLREQMLQIAALMELELDFSEEDVEFADRDRFRSLLEALIDEVERLGDSFRSGNAIKNGVPVAIVGPANAGKSTLLNSILGEQRAIVSDIPGTTRDTIEECHNMDGVMFRFIDTAGVRHACGEIEKIGIERSFDSLRKAEIVLIVLDAAALSETSSSYTPSDEDSFNVLDEVLPALDGGHQKVVIALNKCDKRADLEVNNFVNIKNRIVSLLDNKGVVADIFEVSAKEGFGIKNMLKDLAEYEKRHLFDAASESVTVTNIRHYEALMETRNSLLQVRLGLDTNSPTDLLAEDLRAALSCLGTITGAISTDEVLGEIFGKFCIGK